MVDWLRTFFATVVDCCPILTQNFIEYLILNPRIWSNTDTRVQLDIISILGSDFNFSLTHLKLEKAIDLLMNGVELYVQTDPDRHREAIEKLSGIAGQYLKKCAPIKAVRVLVGYANVRYMRRFRYYPDMLMIAMRLTVDYFIATKPKLIKDLRARVKAKRKCKLISLVLLVIAYLVHHMGGDEIERTCSFKKEDEILKGYQKERFEVIDRTMASCLYLVLSFDWSVFGDLAKEVMKEEASASKATLGFSAGNLLGHNVEEVLVVSLIKLAGKMKGVEMVILERIFQDNKTSGQLLGRIAYQTLISLALNRPKEILAVLSLKSAFAEAPKDSKPIAPVLEFILRLSRHFTSEARELLIGDLAKLLEAQSKSSKEIMENHSLVLSILRIQDEHNDPKLIKIQGDLLCSVISPVQPHWCCYLGGEEVQKLRVLERAIDVTLDSFVPLSDKHGLNVVVKCVDFVYGVEDVVERCFRKEGAGELSELLTKVLGKLLLLLNKADLLYITLPGWSVFEQREPILGRRPEELAHQEREGGILRILLKATCVCVKNAQNDVANSLLRYLVFRDKATKQKIKEYVGRKSAKKPKEKKRQKNQSIINLIFNKIPEETKQYEAINDFYMKKVIGKEYSVLDQRKVGKAASSKEINYFSHPKTLLLHLFASVIQLIYFELLKISSFSEISQPELYAKLIEPYKGYSKKLPHNCKELLQLLADITAEDKENVIAKMLTSELQALIDSHKAKLGTAELKLANMYSSLNSDKKNAKQRASNTAELEAVTGKIAVCMKYWAQFLNKLLKLMSLDRDLHDKEIINTFLASESVFEILPMLLFLTQHPFGKLEDYIDAVADCLVESRSVEEDVVGCVQNVFAHIDVAKEKLQRDVMNSYRIDINRHFYRKIMKEQQSEIGCWFDKSHDKYQKRLYAYVKNKHEKLRKENEKPQLNEFVKLSKSRDKTGRALIMAQLSEIEDNPDYTYNYLRHFVLKKMLIRAFFKADVKKYYKPDFKLRLVKNLFNIQKAEATQNPDPATPEESKQADIKPNENQMVADELAPSKLKPFEVELVTIRGAVFGKLGIYRDSMVFHDARRREGDKYRGCTVAGRQLSARVFKEWRLEKVVEVVVKRYNLTRQAAEIYFSEFNAVFFNFFSEKELLRFMSKFEKTLAKKPEAKVEMVLNPETYFAKRQFTASWASGTISNFDYLMLLNKYAGRSFNDLNQYPVFPWVLSKYKGDAVDLSAKDVYRPLGSVVAGLSPEKVKCAAEKFEILDVVKYQFDQHYLPAKVVFEYMVRIHPFTTLLDRYREHAQMDGWQFKSLADFWDNSMNSSVDNKELIPEFFYLPELFFNHNFRSLCTKRDEMDPRSESDNVILPEWTRGSAHRFIKINSKALESKLVSLELNKWIDLIFGEKQQDPKSLNAYRPLSDEAYVSALKRPLEISELGEVQESGVNPIKLFHERHPAKDEKKVSEKGQYAIFHASMKVKEQGESNPKEEKKVQYALLTTKVFEENQAIIFIVAFERKALTVFTSQKLHQTKEGYINVPHEQTVNFEKKDITLFSFKPFYDNETNTYSFHDSQRCFAARFNGTQLITCRHHDNSWKLTDCTSGLVKESVSFHKRMVTCVCTAANGNIVLTGSNDGVIAMWRHTFLRPTWHAANHYLGVVSVDACEKLDLAVTAGADDLIVLRKLADGKYIRAIRLGSVMHYGVSHVRFSSRGYLIVVEKCKATARLEDDYVSVFSINGEEIIKKQVSIRGNVIVVSEDGYEFIVGGDGGKLLKYKLLTLKEHKIFSDLDAGHKGTRTIVRDFTKEPPSITAMALTMQEGCQQLLFGTNTGHFYIYKCSPRLVSQKIFGSFSGLI